jgi:hypothetical protein
MGKAFLGLEPIFTLDGPNGSCSLWADKLGYQLFYEGEDSYKPEVLSKYMSRVNVFHDAFHDAKHFTGLDDWNMTWFDDDLMVWEDFIKHIEKILLIKE